MQIVHCDTRSQLLAVIKQALLFKVNGQHYLTLEEIFTLLQVPENDPWRSQTWLSIDQFAELLEYNGHTLIRDFVPGVVVYRISDNYRTFAFIADTAMSFDKWQKAQSDTFSEYKGMFA